MESLPWVQFQGNEINDSKILQTQSLNNSSGRNKIIIEFPLLGHMVSDKISLGTTVGVMIYTFNIQITKHLSVLNVLDEVSHE